MNNEFKNIFRGDQVLWILYLGFVMVSILAVYSASNQLTWNDNNDTWTPIISHIGHLILGFIVMYIVHLIPTWYFKSALVLLPVSWIFLVAVMLVSGVINGASRWLAVTELAKICTVITVSVILSRTQREYSAHRLAFHYILTFAGITICLIAPENLSTALILAITIFFMMFVGRVRSHQMISLLLVVMLIAFVFVVLSRVTPESVLEWMYDKPLVHRVSTWMGRVNDFIDGSNKPLDIQGKDAQRIWADVAIVHGGLFGCGIGDSIIRDYLPLCYSDFIFSIIVEEAGFIGAAILIYMYVIFLIRSYRVAVKTRSMFTTLMVTGLSVMLVIQAFMNMAVNVGLMPVTGQPLPFISRGGNSILCCSIIWGLVIGASNQCNKRKLHKGVRNKNVSKDTHS